ncbi:MAG: glutaredoxin 3 [Candidatus Margulisbacteria bacterium]|nr:glutaredoxin 3 [Candidatus Margulisiibacteriota bacterium]
MEIYNETVIIYTTDFCPYCNRAKNLLKAKKVNFREINITGDYKKLEQLEQETGFSTTPQIWIGSRFIGGCDDLYQLEIEKKLDELLQ